MVFAQECKRVQLIAPQVIADNVYWAGSHQHGSINTSVDTKGFNYLAVHFWLGALDIAVAELSLYESDDNSTFAIITASNYATASTLPSATEDNDLFSWYVALGGTRKRYYRINAKAGDGAAGSYAVAWAELWRANETPNSAAERGATRELFIP